MNIGIVIGAIAYTIVLPYLLPLGREIAQRWVTNYGFTLSVILGVILGGLTIKLQTELHEWSHFVVRRLHGKEPKFDNMSFLTRGNPNVQIPGQWATRGENIIVLLAPLLVVDIFALVLIVSNISPLINFLASLAFVINTASAGNDVLGAYDDYRYPEGTMIYYPRDFPKGYIYQPITE